MGNIASISQLMSIMGHQAGPLTVHCIWSSPFEGSTADKFDWHPCRTCTPFFPICLGSFSAVGAEFEDTLSIYNIFQIHSAFRWNWFARRSPVAHSGAASTFRYLQVGTLYMSWLLPGFPSCKKQGDGGGITSSFSPRTEYFDVFCGCFEVGLRKAGAWECIWNPLLKCTWNMPVFEAQWCSVFFLGSGIGPHEHGQLPDWIHKNYWYSLVSFGIHKLKAQRSQKFVSWSWKTMSLTRNYLTCKVFLVLSWSWPKDVLEV